MERSLPSPADAANILAPTDPYHPDAPPMIPPSDSAPPGLSPHLPPPALERPWVIGHRGIPARLPESTLAGFALALDLGADGVELDVHATSDGVVVVHHDPVLPDGREIGRHTLAEFHADAGVRDRMPRLADVLDLAAGRGAAFVEIKGAGIERLVVSEIERSAAECAVHAFDHRASLRVRALAPRLATGVLMAGYLVDSAHAMRTAGAATLWQERAFVDEALVRDVRAAGGQVVAWTVNTADEVRRLARVGVAGICTDDVAMARRALDAPDAPEQG